MRRIVFVLIGLAYTFFGSTQTRKPPEKAVSGDRIVVNQSYSLATAAKYCLVYDLFLNSYTASEKDLDEFCSEQKNYARRMLPLLLKKYDLTLYAQFQLSAQLYLLGNKNELELLWRRHKRLAGDKSKSIEPVEEFRPILRLLQDLKIVLK